AHDVDLHVGVSAAVGRQRAAAVFPAVADQAVVHVELPLLQHFALALARAADDQLQHAFVFRRAPDLVQPGVQFFSRQVLHRCHLHSLVTTDNAGPAETRRNPQNIIYGGTPEGVRYTGGTLKGCATTEPAPNPQSLAPGRLLTDEDFVGPWFELRMIEWNDLRPEAGFRQDPQPVAAGEQALDVAVPLYPRRAVAIAQQIRVVDRVGGVGGIRIPGPFQVAQPAAAEIVPAVIGRGAEVLAHVIGREQRRAAGTAVRPRSLDHLPHLLERRHVDDCVVDEDAVEQAPEAHVPHIPFDVLAFGI